jgi:formylglycine-generating enzyme required for sulfatase activity
VGDPGNPPDTTGHGSVAYRYYISRYEITNAQYAEFLNEKAASDPFELYAPGMAFPRLSGGITRSGAPGSYAYAVNPGFENRPVNQISFYDALRFANWLSNGQADGDTETGAYTLLGGAAVPSNGLTVTRNQGAITFLPSEDEWYKAAYHSPAGVYFDYPNGLDFMFCGLPDSAPSGPRRGNCDTNIVFPDRTTPVGAYTRSRSPWGTFDQGGNVSEWNEDLVGDSQRRIRGGSFSDQNGVMAASFAETGRPYGDPFAVTTGFRVASLVPEPGTALLVTTGLLGLALRRRRRG